LVEVADGLHALIKKSKGDQEGAGQEIATSRVYFLRPGETLQDWLVAADITSGAVFRAMLQRRSVANVIHAECLSRLNTGRKRSDG
jgi:hypothetical protein